MSVSPTQFALLQNRVTALDGIGSTIPSTSSVPTIFADLNGLHTTLNQLVLTIQSQLNQVALIVSTLQSTVNEILGNTTPIVRYIQTERIRYVVASADVGQIGYIPITWPTAFADTNYTVTLDLSLVSPASGVVPWLPSTVYAANAIVIDSNGFYQKTSGGGTSGLSQPMWNEQSHTTDNSITWTPYASLSTYESSTNKTTSGIIAVISWGDPIGWTFDIQAIAVHD